MGKVMKCLVIGSGGREHALCWKLARSPQVSEVHCAPGNGGTADEEKVINHPAHGIAQWLALARNLRPDLIVVGPEAPLAEGIVDLLQADNFRVIGPRKAAAQLETSKAFAKSMMELSGIPTAQYRRFTDPRAALQFVRERGAPIVIKADGLASGKGVVVAHDLPMAEHAIEELMVKKIYGNAGEVLVVEDCLVGEEASFIVLTDGKTVAPFNSSQDHKRLLNEDLGPNTGGMGAYSPAPIIDSAMKNKVMEQVIDPLLATLQKQFPENTAPQKKLYAGFLYAGLMIGDDGIPRVLEFNCRLGDPETQALMVGLQSDLAVALNDLLNGELREDALQAHQGATLGVVIASGGYPQRVLKDKPIYGLQYANSFPNVKIFHGGTIWREDRLVVSGGRVLCVTAQGDTIAQAHRHAYAAIQHIKFEGMQYRSDIGYRAMGDGKFA